MIPERPVVIHISVEQKARILASTPKNLVKFDLDTGAFILAQVPYILFAPWYEPPATAKAQTPARELTVVPE